MRYIRETFLIYGIGFPAGHNASEILGAWGGCMGSLHDMHIDQLVERMHGDLTTVTIMPSPMLHDLQKG